MAAQSLSEYLLLLICVELGVPDILSLRQVCRGFYEATRAKQLWLTLLHTLVSDGHVLPPYLRKPETLDSAALEALVRRVAQLERKWRSSDLHPAYVWRLNMRQSITWLRLIEGRWLFVASSDIDVSKISCWDLSLVFRGHTDPIAEAYLPGQVKTAQVQLQDTGVVLALGLGPKSPSVHLLTLRRDSASHYFAELCCVEGSSHVLMLQGKLVGCAVRDDTVVPHIIDWVANTIYNLPPSAGPDSPKIRSSPHLLISWSNLIVVVRYNSLDVYSEPSPAGGPTYIKSVPTQAIWEVVRLEELTLTSSPLKLLVISPRGLETYTLEYEAAVSQTHTISTPSLLAASPNARHDVPPWYHLCINGTGRRALWVTLADQENNYPYLSSLFIPSSPSGLEENTPILWTNNLPHDPALWAFPCLDFDEALGLTVIGNCFGELAVYDCVGDCPTKSCGSTSDLTDKSIQLPPLSLDPIPLQLCLTPPPPFGNIEPDNILVSHWSQDNLGLDGPWSTDWFSGLYWRWESWQGNRGDIAWLIENAYGFPTSIIPQAYGEPSWSADVDILFRSGGRYFIYTNNEFKSLKSFPMGPLPPPVDLLPGYNNGDHQPCMRPTAYTVANMYATLLTGEFHFDGGRNRWRELSERGGAPHRNLLDTSLVEPLGNPPLLE
ncbi:hypothetical protein C8R47DRAFT_1012885 [Mycena vitilis]|nr:hypothetical protein C8R47DRAFT_1012885 [Mycena vitilis]